MFSEGIENIAKTRVKKLKTLPLSHNCNFNHLDGILNGKKLEAKSCNIFEDNLVYFFYGKPSYFKKKHKIPVFLLFEFNDSEELHRVAPFDTGAYYTGKLNGVEKQSLNDEKDINSLNSFCYNSAKGQNTELYNKRIIQYFFKDNLNYYDNNIRNNIKNYNSCCLHYKSIIENGPFDDKYDDRAASIEVQFLSDFDINKNKLIYAFIPKDMKEAWVPKLRKINKNVEIVIYPTSKLSGGVAKMAGIASESVKNFLISKKLL